MTGSAMRCFYGKCATHLCSIPIFYDKKMILCSGVLVFRVVLRWNCAKVIANIDDLAISIWAPKVIDELSQIDDI